MLESCAVEVANTSEHFRSRNHEGSIALIIDEYKRTFVLHVVGNRGNNFAGRNEFKELGKSRL